MRVNGVSVSSTTPWTEPVVAPGLWIVAAPSTNSAPIYANPTTVATSVAAFNVEIYPGESKYLLVDTEENGQGLSLISSSGVVNSALLSKANFRTRLGYALGAFAAAVAAAVASTFFVALNATTVKLKGSYSAIRGSSALALGNSDGTDAMTMGSGILRFYTSGTQRSTIQSGQFSVEQATALVWYTGAQTGEIHRWNATGYLKSAADLTAATPTAGYMARDSTYGTAIADGTSWSAL